MLPINLPEIWKPIPGWPYMASDEGRILSMTRLIPHWKTGNACIKQPRVLKPKKTQFGYQVVTLQCDKVKRQAFVHVLIAEAFFGKKQPGHVVNHVDFIRNNNWIGNLEYVTYSENVMHSMRQGRYPLQRGEDHGFSKLKSKDVLEIRASLKTGDQSAADLASKYNVSQAIISMIKHRKVLRHI